MPAEVQPSVLKLAQKLGLDIEEQNNFIESLLSGTKAQSAVVITPTAPKDYTPPFSTIPTDNLWGHPSILIPNSQDQKVGSHTDYNQGYYYPLDISSVWETAALNTLPQTPRRCLDLCAAPGGKTILAQTRLHIPLHIANEVHPKRLGILRHNLKRCGFTHLYTQRLRPDQWADQAPESFDLLIVDAPCSGQSLIAKGIKNPGCFNQSVTGGNAKRQKGILLSAIQCLAPGGYLLYSTCTYAPDENEKAMAYILKRNPDIKAIDLPALKSWQSQISDFPCYRLMPHQGVGAGGFCCLLHKEGNTDNLPELSDELLAWPVAQSSITQLDE